MRKSQLLSLTNQTVELIRQGIEEGRWRDLLPGRARLAKELGISPATAGRALNFLAEEGLLESRGANRSYGIRADPDGKKAKRSGDLHLLFLPRTSDDQTSDVWVSAQYESRLLKIKAETCDFTLADLKFDLDTFKRHSKQLNPDAWVIQGAPKEILRWLGGQPVPAFAFGGSMLGIDIAGAGFDAREGLRSLTRKLIGLGHTRIVLLWGATMTRNPKGGPVEIFAEEMKSHGIPMGTYNLPILKDNSSTAEVMNCLTNLFRYTPPTALLVGHPALYHVTKDFLWESGRTVPKACSLACLYHLPGFEREHPSPTHLKADLMQLLTPFTQWARSLEQGRPHRKQTHIPFTLMEGESIGPTPSSRS